MRKSPRGESRHPAFLLPEGAGNVSATVVAGTLSLADLSAGQGIQFLVEAKGDRKQKDRRSILKAGFYAKSLTDGESDQLNCTVAKKP